MKTKTLYDVITNNNGTVVHSGESCKKPNLEQIPNVIGVYLQEIKVSEKPIRYDCDMWGDDKPIYHYERVGQKKFQSVSDFIKNN
jgi:hypothetical protein